MERKTLMKEMRSTSDTMNLIAVSSTKQKPQQQHRSRKELKLQTRRHEKKWATKVKQKP